MTLSDASVEIKESVMSVVVVLNDYFKDSLRFRMDFYGDMLPNPSKFKLMLLILPRALISHSRD